MKPAATCRSTRWPPTGPGGLAGERVSPASSSRRQALARPASRAARPRVCARCGATRLSISDRLPKTRLTWKERTSPCGRSHAASGRRGSPGERTSPEVGGCTPVIRLTKVDLPAPFGPMMPRSRRAPPRSRSRHWRGAAEALRELARLEDGGRRAHGPPSHAWRTRSPNSPLGRMASTRSSSTKP